jgi:hypothetical protein
VSHSARPGAGPIIVSTWRCRITARAGSLARDVGRPVRACACACACACPCACMRACLCMRACVCLCACRCARAALSNSPWRHSHAHTLAASLTCGDDDTHAEPDWACNQIRAPRHRPLFPPSRVDLTASQALVATTARAVSPPPSALQVRQQPLITLLHTALRRRQGAVTYAWRRPACCVSQGCLTGASAAALLPPPTLKKAGRRTWAMSKPRSSTTLAGLCVSMANGQNCSCGKHERRRCPCSGMAGCRCGEGGRERERDLEGDCASGNAHVK